MSLNNEIKEKRLPCIISTLGSKGGTGKSTILLSLIYIFSRISKKTLIINTDESSQSLPLRLSELKIDETTYLINMTVTSLIDFINFNRGMKFIEMFDYIFIDLKGSDIDKSIFKEFIKLVDYFILPVMPSKDGIPAFHGTLEQLKECIIENKTMSYRMPDIFKNAIEASKKNTGVHTFMNEVMQQFESYDEKYQDPKIIILQNNHGYTNRYLAESGTVKMIESIVGENKVNFFYDIDGIQNLESRQKPVISVTKHNREVISKIISIVRQEYYAVESEDGDE